MALVTCPSCEGTGQCYHCHGRGVDPDEDSADECFLCDGLCACPDCEGEGWIDERFVGPDGQATLPEEEA